MCVVLYCELLSVFLFVCVGFLMSITSILWLVYPCLSVYVLCCLCLCVLPTTYVYVRACRVIYRNMWVCSQRIKVEKMESIAHTSPPPTKYRETNQLCSHQIQGDQPALLPPNTGRPSSFAGLREPYFLPNIATNFKK